MEKSLDFIKNFKKIIKRNKSKNNYHLFQKYINYGQVIYNKETNTYIRNILDHKFHLNPNDLGLSLVLARDGIREKESVEAMFKYVKPDMKIFDLGSNIGFYVLIGSFIIKKGNGKGKIYSVEPTPESYRILKLNIEDNGYKKYVEADNVAIGEKTGTMKFGIYSAANSNRIINPEIDNPLQAIDITTYTLEDYLVKKKIKFDYFDFLRMDVEGSEYDIILGSIDKIKRKEKFLMFIEFHPHINKIKHIEVIKALENIGFKCLTVTKEYPKSGKIFREYRPNTSIKQLYEDDFFTQGGGCEVFLKKI